MDSQRLISRYRELQQYVGWTDEDAARVHAAAALVSPFFPSLVEDFYEEIERHPDAVRVITGGHPQIERLKGTLVAWLEQLFSGKYDSEYVLRRWRIGYRHVEIGLDQVYTNVALSRLRRGVLNVLEQVWVTGIDELLRVRASLNTLIDLDLALIEDAYQTEHMQRHQAAERLALIGQVAGGVAHELRNPLNVIKTSVFYLLNARNASPEKTASHLQRIERQVSLADDVISSLVRFARMPLPEMKPFSIEGLVREAVEEIERPANVELAWQFSDDVNDAVGDANQIRIVLDNLIRNAYEAMRDGGRLTVGTSGLPQHVDLIVADTGHGIEPDKLKRVMEPFYSTKPRGMGLGLAMAKAIVEKNDGWLTAASEPGAGATFTVRLKAHRAT